jgi:hypothetical protein
MSSHAIVPLVTRVTPRKYGAEGDDRNRTGGRFRSSHGDLQNRNARFDSSVPRPEDRLYRAKFGFLEPEHVITPSEAGPLQTAPDRCSRRVSVHRTVHSGVER